jgi:hypothetical protein
LTENTDKLTGVLMKMSNSLTVLDLKLAVHLDANVKRTIRGAMAMALPQTISLRVIGYSSWIFS